MPSSERPVPTLEQLLATPIERLEPADVHAFTLTGALLPAELLLQLIEQPSNPSLQCVALFALGKHRTSMAIDILLQQLKVQRSGTRNAILLALQELVQYPQSGPGNATPPYSSPSLFSLLAYPNLCHDLALSEDLPAERLLGVLECTDEGARAAAVKIIGTRQTEQARILLQQALNDHEEAVWFTALRVLEERGEPFPLELLLRGYADPECWEIALEIKAMILRQWKLLPSEWVLAELDHTSWTRRETAIEILGIYARNHMPFSCMTQVACQTTSVPETAQVFTSRAVATGVAASQRRLQLETTGMPFPLERLVAALEDEYHSVREAAILALGDLDQQEVPIEELLRIALEDQEVHTRLCATKMLFALGHEAPIDPWIATLQHTDWRARVNAICALSIFGDRIPIDLFIHALTDEDDRVQARAVEVLDLQQQRVPLKLLFDIMDTNPPERTRAAVISALGRREEAIPAAFFLSAMHDSDSTVRAAAIEAAGKRNDPLLIEHIYATLEDDTFYVRSQAVETLLQFGEQTQLDRLWPLVYDDALYHKGQLVAARAMRDNAQPREMFIAMLGEVWIDMRDAALQALRQMAPEALDTVVAEASAVLQMQPAGAVLGSHVQLAIIEIIDRLKLPLLPFIARLLQLLDWPYWRVRRQAAKVLGKLAGGQRDLVMARLAALSQQDPVLVVRQEAVEALARLDGDQSSASDLSNNND